MATNAQQKNFVLQGDLTQVMWTLSLPAIAAMVLFGLNAFMDTVYIGQLMNQTALAGVALAYPLTNITMCMGSWAGTGAGNLLSIVLGRDDEATQQKILGNATFFMLVATVILAIPSYIWAEELIGFMGGNGAVLTYGTTYFKVTLLGAPLWVYGLGLNFVVRSEGKMKEAAIMMSYGLVVNLILTPIFIHYLQMGIAGAAWATNIGMLLYVVVGYRYFHTGQASFEYKSLLPSYDSSVLINIIKLGFPGFILNIMGLVQAVVVFNVLTQIGTEDELAFFAASNRIHLFLVTPLFGLMRALQPVAGINFGAQQYDRVKASFVLFCKTGFGIIAPFWLVLTLFPATSLQLVLPDMVFRPQDLWYFQVYSSVLPFFPIVFMALTYLPAIEQPQYASLIVLARQLIFYVPVMLLLPQWMGIGGVYYGAIIIDFVLIVVLLYLVWWTSRQLGQTEQDPKVT